MSNNAVLGRAFAHWCGYNKIPKPTTREGFEVLFAQFLNQQPDNTQQVIGGGANHYEIHDTHETHLVNDGSTVQIADPAPQGIYKSDWDDMLEQRAKASIGPNGELLDDFDQEFELMNAHTQATNDAAPATNTNPLSSITAILGGSATLQAGQAGTSPVPTEVARWNGADSETTNVTVTIGPSVPTAQAGSGAGGIRQSIPYAVVQWGTRGISMIAYVDASIGAQFTIGASYVSLSLAMQSLYGYNGLNGVPQPTLLSGMLSFRQITKASQLTYSVIVPDLDAAATVGLFPVPPFATTLRVMGGYPTTADPQAAYPFKIQFLDKPNGGQVLGTASAFSSNLAVSSLIPVPPNSRSFNLVGVTPPSSVFNLFMVFGLSL